MDTIKERLVSTLERRKAQHHAYCVVKAALEPLEGERVVRGFEKKILPAVRVAIPGIGIKFSKERGEGRRLKLSGKFISMNIYLASYYQEDDRFKMQKVVEYNTAHERLGSEVLELEQAICMADTAQTYFDAGVERLARAAELVGGFQIAKKYLLYHFETLINLDRM